MAEPLFSLNQVSYTYPGGIPGLCNLTWSVQPGERAAIIGANGTGKSTLLALLDGLILATQGNAHAFGKPLTEKAFRDPEFQRYFRQKIGFVFQNPDIQLFCPTVKEDLLFGPLNLDMSREKMAQRLDWVVNLMKLEPLLERSPHRLSIGEKKKAAIASVLIMDPEVLLLDEPTAGLDPQTTRDIIQVIYDAHQAGKTVVMATHDLHVVEEIADIVHVFGPNHTILRSGTAASILSDDPFMRENNLIHLHVHRHPHGNHLHPH